MTQRPPEDAPIGAGTQVPAPIALPAVGSDTELEERVVGSRLVHRGRYLELRIDTIERADGSQAEREIVGHPGAVAIVAIDDADRVLLVRQWRTAAGRALLEIPAGTLDVGDDGAVEDPELAAKRELEEETGYRAASWERLASFWTAPGFATELMHLYLATGLSPAHADRLGPDEDERLTLEAIPWQEAIALSERGEIADAKSIVGLLHLARLREKPAAPEVGPGDERLVHASFVLTRSDIVRATIALATLSRSTVVLGLGLVILSLPLLVLTRDPINLIGVAFGLLFASGLFMVPVVWFQLRKRPELFTQRSEVWADRRGIRYLSPFGNSSSPWTAFRDIRERGGFIFLDTGVGASVPVPARAFAPADLERFRSLLALSVGVDER